MKLDTIVLILVCVLAALWLLVLLAGLIAAWPVGLIGLAVIAIPGYVLHRVIADRLRNREDDHYEKTVDR